MNNLRIKFQLSFFFFLFSVFCFSSLHGAEVKQIKIEKVDKKIKVLVFTDASKYEDTTLNEPQRIVVDFLNSSSFLPQMITSDYPPLLRIRTSQYRIEPSPITRVVLDLDHEFPYSISRTKQGVEINLGKEDTVKVKLPPPEKPAPPKKVNKEVIQEAVEEAMDSILPKMLQEIETGPEGEISKKVQKTLIRRLMEEMKSKGAPELASAMVEYEEVFGKEHVEKFIEKYLERRFKKEFKPVTPEPFSYSSKGRRDPFKPYLGVPSKKDTLLDVGSAAIVGIMWSPEERYALAEDASGKAFILKEGDQVSGGKVLTIEKKEVIFLMHVFGGTRKVSLKIIPKKEEK